MSQNSNNFTTHNNRSEIVHKARLRKKAHHADTGEDHPVTQYYCNPHNVDCFGEGEVVDGEYFCQGHRESKEGE